MRNFFHTTFSSLKIRNYKLYYFGQAISVSGTFLQALAQDWLILQLTNSGTMLGLVSAVQFLPMLFLVSWGGIIADRFPKLKILYITQVASGLLALLLGTLILVGAVQIWMVFVFALCLGLINSIDSPTRQTFVFEMVGKDEVKNAVSLWGVLISSTRIIGPAVAGILIATVGIGMCFIFNAISYIAVITAFLMMRREELHTVAPVPHAKGQIREGLRYVLASPLLLAPLVMMGIIGTLTFEWQASMPLLARFVLHGNAATYSYITVAMAIGMILGGFVNARSSSTSLKRLSYAALLLGIFVLTASLASTLVFALIAFFFVGIFLMGFSNLTSSILQINTDPKMRGRVMSLWSMAFFGSTTIGGPIIGWIGQTFGAQWSLATGGFAAILAALYGLFRERKQ
jgi:MFS family permease